MIMLTPLAKLFQGSFFKLNRRSLTQESIKFAFFFSLKGEVNNMIRIKPFHVANAANKDLIRKAPKAEIGNESEDEQESGFGQNFSAKRNSEVESLLSKILGRQFQFLSDNNPQTYNQLYAKFLQEYKNLDDNELFYFLYFSCSRSFRGAFLEKIQKISEVVLAELKIRGTFSRLKDGSGTFLFMNEKIPQLLISLSNIAVFDHEVFELYLEHLLSRKETLMAEKTIMVKTALSLLWSILKLRVDIPEGKIFLVSYLESSQQYFSTTNWLRFLWICAMDQEKNAALINHCLSNFFRRKAEKEFFSYNPKNSSQIRQIFFELFPECINGASPQNSNVYIAHYPNMKRLALISASLSESKEMEKNGSMVKISVSYIEKHSNPRISSDKGFGTNYFILKNTNQHYSGKFEKNVEENLRMMKDITLQSNVHVGLYEVDFVINKEIVLEINGGQHYVCEILKGSKGMQKKMLLLQFDAKMRYLAAKGFKKLAIINHYDWDKVDLKTSNKLRYIQKVLETSIDLKSL